MTAWTGIVSLFVYWGFAGVFGALIYHRLFLVAGVFGGFVLLPASVGIPAELFTRILGWLGGILVIAMFLKRPSRAPDWLWGKTFALSYLIGLMLLIGTWGIISGYVGLGVISGVAGVVAVYRLGYRENY